MAAHSDYSTINDYELLYMIHQKEEAAIAMLLNKYEGYLWALIRQRWEVTLPGLEREDLIILLRVKLLEAVENYNEEKNCSFCTYMTMCAVRRISSLRRTVQREQRAFPNLVSLDCIVKEEGGSYLQDRIKSNQQWYDPAFFVEYQSLVEAAKQFLAMLTEREKQVWDCMMVKMNYEEAAKRLKMSRKSYDNAVFRLKRKFNAVLKKSQFD